MVPLKDTFRETTPPLLPLPPLESYLNLFSKLNVKDWIESPKNKKSLSIDRCFSCNILRSQSRSGPNKDLRREMRVVDIFISLDTSSSTSLEL